MDDNLTQEQKEKVIENYRNKKSRQFNIGRIIVITIAAINVIMSFVSFFIQHNFISLIIQIALSIALIMGVAWVRYLYAIGAGLSILITINLLGSAIDGSPIWLIIFLILELIYSIVSCILLFGNKCVSEFLYSQKNG